MNTIAATIMYNTPDLAEAMLAQLPGVVIVDNGSEPPIERVVFHLLENRYFAGGWNDSMKFLDSADAVWMLNSDVEGVTPDMLAQLVRVMEADGYAVVTPAFNSPHATFHAQGLTAPRGVSWIDWTCPLVSVAAWRDVGGFDERFIGYGADIDWCKRARDKGYKFAVCDWLNVHHVGSVTALRNGLQGYQGDVGRMNQLLREKWGVNDWSELTR